MRWLEELRRFAAAEALALLEALVSAPSINPPGNEGLAARPLASFLIRHGISVQWQETAPGRPNLVAPVTSVASGSSLALCSHLDVAPPGDLTRWSEDPFTPRLADGRLYGRGACDAKGCLTAMAVAVAFFARHPELLRGTLMLTAVCGEERFGTGAKALVASGFRADGVVIGEPTNLQVQIGHKGRLEVVIRIQGRGGHAARAMIGDNPIPRLAEVLARAELIWTRVSDRTHPLLGTASLAPTQVSSGDTSAATVPDVVTLTLDRRLLPGETHAEAAEEIRGAYLDLPSVEVEVIPGASPYLLSEDHPVVGACQAGVAAATGIETTLGGFTATCDQHTFGHAGIPAAILGPGDLVTNRAHAPNEFISVASVEQAALAYAATARAFLGG